MEGPVMESGQIVKIKSLYLSCLLAGEAVTKGKGNELFRHPRSNHQDGYGEHQQPE